MFHPNGRDCVRRPAVMIAIRHGLAMLLVVFGGSSLQAQPDSARLAQQAQAILKTNCARCHGPGGTNQGGFSYVLDVPKLVEKKKLIPGDLEKSSRRGLLAAMLEGAMPPPEEKIQPSAADIETIKAWIQSGAPPFADNLETARKFISHRDDLAAMNDYLLKRERQDRPFQRFFSLRHLHNDRTISAGALRLYRAALAKLLNSLSWQADIFVPIPVDAEQSMFAVDLRQVGWAKGDMWRELLKNYPYGLGFEHDPDPQMQSLAQQVYDMAGTKLPLVRVDWFAARAAQPPLYHTMLHIPTTGAELEKMLKVDPVANFMQDNLIRAGFTKSGVSGQNRLVERHPSSYGAYWKSYDFKSNEGRGNLFRFPLGPLFSGNPYAENAFVQDGGEIIFNLPNGLQGYMLIDGKDHRIDKGPIEVVHDGQQTAGTPLVVNGLSCMSCHRTGMITEFKDIVREGSALLGQPREKVRRLFKTEVEMQKWLRKDQERFLSAYEIAAGPLLKVGPDRDRNLADFTTEPIGELARRYLLRELTLDEAALELGLNDPLPLKTAIRLSDRLRQLGLGPLAQGATLKRDVWESVENYTSPFQEAASVLDLGTPRRLR